MSVAASLPAIDRAVEQLLESSANDSLIAVTGDPSAGKSTVLARFARALRDEGRRPVLDLSVLRGFEADHRGERYGLADDAGVALLTRAAHQLATVDSSPMSILESGGATWSSLETAIRTSIERHKPVVVIDDILGDRAEPAFDSFFLQRTWDALDVLLGEGTTRVVSALPRAVAAHTTVNVEATSRATEMLAPPLWNGLGASAAALAVSLVSLGADPAAFVERGTRAMVRTLFETLGTQGTLLRGFLAKLALSRRPFDERLLADFGVDSLDAQTQSLLRHGILYEEAGRYVLHETFAREASAFAWLSGPELRAAHETLAEHHSHVLASTSLGATTVLEHELEAFHHFGLAGRSDVGNIRVWLAEQLDALGKSLSLRGLHDDAVRVYEQAIVRDPSDWYARHYLAFNLDVQGKDASRVEAEYMKALSLHQTHVWHHGRLACFYVTRSRTRDAEGAFRRAERLLEPRHGLDMRLYSELHRPLARLFLHRGQLEHGRKVLDAVPATLRGDARWWRALDQLHQLLEEAELDEAVFPPLDVAPEDRWCEPQLVTDPDARLRLESWTPGRITHVDDRCLTVRISPEPGSYGWRDIPADSVSRLWRASESAKTAGTYVEIVKWRNGTEEILVHTPRAIADLPPLLPAPDRYLRALTGHAAPDGA
jgi:tetratricopeptide (TPR) repeat protein